MVWEGLVRIQKGCGDSQGWSRAWAAVGRREGSTVSRDDRKDTQGGSPRGTRAARLLRFGRSTSYRPVRTSWRYRAPLRV